MDDRGTERGRMIEGTMDGMVKNRCGYCNTYTINT
jgi:hypothetical protein